MFGLFAAAAAKRLITQNASDKRKRVSPSDIRKIIEAGSHRENADARAFMDAVVAQLNAEAESKGLEVKDLSHDQVVAAIQKVPVPKGVDTESFALAARVGHVDAVKLLLSMSPPKDAPHHDDKVAGGALSYSANSKAIDLLLQKTVESPSSRTSQERESRPKL